MLVSEGQGLAQAARRGLGGSPSLGQLQFDCAGTARRGESRCSGAIWYPPRRFVGHDRELSGKDLACVARWAGSSMADVAPKVLGTFATAGQRAGKPQQHGERRLSAVASLSQLLVAGPSGAATRSAPPPALCSRRGCASVAQCIELNSRRPPPTPSAAGGIASASPRDLRAIEAALRDLAAAVGAEADRRVGSPRRARTPGRAPTMIYNFQDDARPDQEDRG